MKDDTLAHLDDVLRAATFIKEFVKDKDFDEYQSDELFRSGVERKFEIAGEAMVRIRTDDPSVLEKIRDCRDIISFRNILIHGYDTIDNRIVWGVIEEDLDALHLAYASFYKIDFLLTWNCNHLANANKKEHIRVINNKLGLFTPELTTPLELIKEQG